MAVWSTAAANELIARSKSKGEPLTHMQIQKLVYIAHGWTLALCNERLTLDDPEAWRFGPVYRLLWDRLKYAGKYPITKQIPQESILPYLGADQGRLTKNAKRMMKNVYGFYGEFPAFKLSAITHSNGTPWQSIYADGKGRDEIIPRQSIRSHFQELGGAK